MFSFTRRHRLAMIVSLAAIIACASLLTLNLSTEAADHGDAPFASLDRSADLADVYIFREPTDNSRVFLAMTTQGFIVPGEAVNFGIFDPDVRYRFELEMTGDATPDKFIDIRFTKKTQAATEAQIATITLPDGTTFSAPTTVPNLNPTPPPRVITTHQASGVQFFAGLVDDAFLFDIPGFNRFLASVRAANGNLDNINANLLKRGRDAFAGYNTLAIAFSFPMSALQPTVNNEIGLDAVTSRVVNVPRSSRFQRGGSRTQSSQIDRAGNPAVNVVLIPFARKDEHNFSTTLDYAAGRFDGSIAAGLRTLGTSEQNINTILQITTKRGDFIRLNLNVPNTGPGDGTSAEAAFPNGRRMSDDVVDILLTVVTNGFVTTDNANTLDMPLTNTFPYFGLPHQPREPGTIDDQTRN